MRGRGLVATSPIIVLVFLLIASLADARVFEFQRAKGIKVDVLPYYDFYIKFGNNPEIPRTNEEVIALARKLYPPLGKRRLPEAGEKVVKECGTYDFGLLFAALQNPDITDATRLQVDSIIANSEPTFNPPITIGHFKFYYTDSDTDPDHNVTLEEIKETARYLNRYWREYERTFKPPLHYVLDTTQMIDVRVYYDPWYVGRALPSWNYIFLNSKDCVKDDCKRKTASAHELFHRVQFNYGLGETPSGIAWIAEGTAIWAQKYTNRLIRDYMEPMNWGLGKPDVALITGRDYDASHFWVYLDEQAGQSGQKGWTAIRDVWANYEAIKKNNPDMTEAEATRAAVNAVLPGAVGVDFDGFVQLWIKTNYIKDLANADRTYDYDEDEVQRTNCGRTYGPLSQVGGIDGIKKISVPAFAGLTISGPDVKVSAYGADYYEISSIPVVIENLSITCDGDEAGDFSWHVIGIRDNKWVEITDSISTDFTYTKTLTPGQWDKVALIVGGREKGGSYEISLDTCSVPLTPVDLTGTWVDNFVFCWTLTQNGTVVSGTVINTSYIPSFAGPWQVTGSYIGQNLSLTATNPPEGQLVCPTFTCSGTANNCWAEGTITSDVCRFIGGDSWLMTRRMSGPCP